MKMQKYTAPDMRTALRKVRAEHGPDALILWTRRAAGVVELTVAMDAEAAARAGTSTPERRVVGGEPLHAPVPPIADAPVVPAAPAATVLDLPMPAPVSVPATAPEVAPAAALAPAIDGELKALRRLLETQLAALAWNDLTRRAPVTAELIREFAALGIERDLAADVLSAVAEADDIGTARRAAHAALVSAGETRFGAFEHLARLGRLLGVPTYQVDDAAELPALLARLGGLRLVLIDTPAPANRGEDLEAQARSIAALRSVGPVAVALPATMQAPGLRLAAARYARLGATACIATRLDEAASLGGLLSASIGAALPFAFVTDGTSLPDDLRPARADDLVELAVTLVQRHGTAADEDLLACRAEGRLHVAS